MSLRPFLEGLGVRLAALRVGQELERLGSVVWADD